MKKNLFLQTALATAAGLTAAGAAAAQTKEVPIGVTVGGYYEAVFKAQHRDSSPTLRDTGSTDFGSPDAEIWFSIRGVLDNGLVVGGRIELEASTESDQIDETYMFLERGDLGRVELGATDRAGSKMFYGAPTAIPGYGTIDPPGNPRVNNNPGGAVTVGNYMKFTGQDDSEAINIFTAANRYFGSKPGKGLQLGFSYVPNGCQDYGSGTSTPPNNNYCGAGFSSTANSGQVSRAYQVAANYLESFGPVDVALYGGYTRFAIEATSAGSLTTGSATLYQNSGLSGYNLGTTLTYNVGDGSSVQAGGGYKREDTGLSINGDNAERQVYSAGVRYLTNGVKPGSIGVGVDFARTKADQGNVGGTAVGGQDKYTWYSAGVTYQVAAGILAFAGGGQYKYDDAVAAGTVVNGITQTDNDSKATFGVVGMRLDF